MAAKPARKGGVVLYEMPYSHYCVKVRKLLDFKGVTYERRLVAYHDKRELLKASGQDYVPWLKWGDEGVAWDRIVDFLEQADPAPSAFPPGSEGQARILEQWAHEILEERVWRYVVPEMPATFKDDVERWVFEEMQHRKRGPMEKLKARQPEFLADMNVHLGFLEASLRGSEYLLGDAPCVADFAVYGALYPLEHVGKDIPAEFPRLRAWYDRVAKV